MRWTRLCELGEDLCLQIQDLRYSLDDHIHIVQVVELGGGRQASAHGVGVRLRELLLGDILGEQLVGKGQTLVDGLLGAVDEGDGDLSSAGGHEGNA